MFFFDARRGALLLDARRGPAAPKDAPRRGTVPQALETIAAFLIAAATLQLACWTDVDGYARLHSPTANDFMALSIRYCFELALFRACETYRRAMDGLLQKQRTPAKRRTSTFLRQRLNRMSASVRSIRAMSFGAPAAADPAKSESVLYMSVAAGLWTLAFAAAQKGDLAAAAAHVRRYSQVKSDMAQQSAELSDAFAAVAPSAPRGSLRAPRPRKSIG